MDVIEIYLYANDERWLFNKMRKHSTAKGLAARMTSAELVQWLNDHGPELPQTVDEVADLYVHLIALVHHKPIEVQEALEHLVVPKEPWMPRVIDIIKKELAV
jgi:phosphoribosyl-ATP pyrophosphohydrolase